MTLHLLCSKNGGLQLRLLCSKHGGGLQNHLLSNSSPFFYSTPFPRRHINFQKKSRIGYVTFTPRFLPSASSVASFREEEGHDVAPASASPVPGQEEERSDMARAFNVSSRTATAVSVCISMAALSLPLAMSSLGQGMGLRNKVLSYITLLSGFYMAWNIGANDVANAMGTSVGSGALSLRQAVLTAAVLEFFGAFLMGRHVTSTMQKGILMSGVFQGKENLLFAGLLSCLAAAGTWLQGPLHICQA